jgi:hypothetical protein
MLLLIIALALFRPVQISEWLVTIIGLLTPFYFLFVYFFVWDQWALVNEIIPPHRLSFPSITFNWQFWVSIVLLVFPALIGFFISNRYSLRLVVQGRKNWNLVFYYLIIALCIPFINNYSGMSHFILAVIPISIYTAAFYAFPTGKRFMELTIWLSFAWVAWLYFGN